MITNEQITVGIIYSGRKKSFENLLKSLLNQNIKINILIFNNTKENLISSLENFKNKEIFKSNEVASPAKARNKLILECKSQYILLVDEDMVLDENCIINFKNFLDQNKDISIVGALLKEEYYIRPTIYRFEIGFNKKFNYIWRRAYNHRPLIKKNIYAACTDFVHPPFMINLKSKKISNFDINYNWGSELYDFFYNNYLSNIKVMILSNVMNYHFPETYTLKTKKDSREVNNIEGRDYFEKKWKLKIIDDPYRFKDIIIYRIASFLIRFIYRIKK